MSFVSSGRQSSTPSILKRPGKVRTSPGHSVKFQLTSNLKSLLVNYLTEKNQNAYVEMICRIRDAGNQLTDDEFAQIITETKDCISILDENLKLFVQVLLLLKWVHRGDEAIHLYKNFVLDLCSAHNYYTKFAIQQLVAVFSEVVENSLHCGCSPSEQEERAFRVVHEVIRCLLKIIPMSKDVLLNAVKSKYPFRKEKDRSHLNFVHNLLTIATYEPTLRREILLVIITKLIDLDTTCSKEEIERLENSNKDTDVFAMEVDDVAPVDDVTSEQNMVHDGARTLDFCLYRLYKYIHNECHDKNNVLKWDKTSVLYQDFLHIFENVILPTYGWNHTQFIMLYLISFKRKLTENFVNYLWNKVTSTTVTPVMREAAVCYLAGFLCHASFVSTEIIKNMLQNMSHWLHTYIASSKLKDEDRKSMVRIHAVFYATCQSMFYLVNLRHGEFVNSNKGLKFLTKLNLGQIAMSSFEPLKMCKRSIVNQFIKVTKTYQLAYCVPIVSCSDDDRTSNFANMWLDGSFPFDSYILKRSNEYIKPIRRQMGESCNNRERSGNDLSDDEDFIPAGPLSVSPVVPVLEWFYVEKFSSVSVLSSPYLGSDTEILGYDISSTWFIIHNFYLHLKQFSLYC